MEKPRHGRDVHAGSYAQRKGMARAFARIGDDELFPAIRAEQAMEHYLWKPNRRHPQSPPCGTGKVPDGVYVEVGNSRDECG